MSHWNKFIKKIFKSLDKMDELNQSSPNIFLALSDMDFHFNPHSSYKKIISSYKAPTEKPGQLL